MTENHYDIGDDVRLTGTFTDVNDSNVDPTAVAAIVKKPNGSYIGYLSSGFSSQGNWDANANSPSLADGTGTAGHYYTVSVAGSVDFGDGAISFAAGDLVYYNGVSWRRIPSPSATAVTKSAVGIYYVDQPVLQAGNWRYRFESAGSRAGEEGLFVVDSSYL